MKSLAGLFFVISDLSCSHYRSGIFIVLLILASLYIPGCPNTSNENDPTKDIIPNADAGKDQKVMTGQRVYLNAVKNTLVDFTYQWSKTSGSDVTLNNGATARANFVPATAGTYVIQLTVNNGDLEDTDSVTITVIEQDASYSIPVAEAGANRSAAPNVTVELDGRASYDPDGADLTYSWRQIDGTSVELSEAETAQPTFTTPAVSEDEDLTFELYVKNPDGFTAIDTVTITVSNSVTTTQYNLGVRSDGSGSVVPNQGAYAEGSAVVLTATGNNGWDFDHWENDLVSEANPATIIINNNTFIKAIFINKTYSLTVLTEGEGTVALDPSGGYYDSFTEITLTPTPANSLWKFDRWSGDITESDNPATISMDEDKEITAIFVSVDQVSAPSFSPDSYTIFQDSVAITITSATADAKIYYTLDDTDDPTQSDTLYTGPITLTGNTTIKARAFKDGMTASDIITAYYLTEEVPG
jgi:hypothetical protein